MNAGGYLLSAFSLETMLIVEYTQFCHEVQSKPAGEYSSKLPDITLHPATSDLRNKDNILPASGGEDVHQSSMKGS
jgi:hypothetical protein